MAQDAVDQYVAFEYRVKAGWNDGQPVLVNLRAMGPGPRGSSGVCRREIGEQGIQRGRAHRQELAAMPVEEGVGVQHLDCIALGGAAQG